MKRQNFIKNIENFTCEHCGTVVTGNGYTNHCPNCLYSKHVDIIPGDRENACKGLMKPTGYIKKNGKEYIIHVCEICGEERLNKISPNDNRDVLFEIMARKPFKI